MSEGSDRERASEDDEGGEHSSHGSDEIDDLRTIADYQFGAGAGEALFRDAAGVRIERTTSGRPQQIHVEAGRLVSFGTDGRYTLGLEGGRRLQDALDHPAYRVVVGDESEPFVRDGRNVFSKFVTVAGAEIRAGDEVLVVHEDGHLLAVGRAELDGPSILEFETGMAVAVRSAVGPATED